MDQAGSADGATLARPTAILQPRLAHLVLLALRFGDREGGASHPADFPSFAFLLIFGFHQFESSSHSAGMHNNLE